MKSCLSIVFIAFVLAGCGQPGEDPASAQTDISSAETADEFVARANAELEELGRELGAAGWVRASCCNRAP